MISLKQIHAVNYFPSSLILLSLFRLILILSSLKSTLHLVASCFNYPSVYACVSQVVSLLGFSAKIVCVILISP
jgi:hypothetical protein